MYCDYFKGFMYNYPYPMLSEIQKTYLANYKQYLLQLKDSVAECAKQIEEALSLIDKEEAKLNETEFK